MSVLTSLCLFSLSLLSPCASQLDRLSEVLHDLSSASASDSSGEESGGEVGEEEGKQEMAVDEEDEEERAKLPYYVSKFKVGVFFCWFCVFWPS